MGDRRVVRSKNWKSEGEKVMGKTALESFLTVSLGKSTHYVRSCNDKIR